MNWCFAETLVLIALEPFEALFVVEIRTKKIGHNVKYLPNKKINLIYPQSRPLFNFATKEGQIPRISQNRDYKSNTNFQISQVFKEKNSFFCF